MHIVALCDLTGRQRAHHSSSASYDLSVHQVTDIHTCSQTAQTGHTYNDNFHNILLYLMEGHSVRGTASRAHVK